MAFSLLQAPAGPCASFGAVHIRFAAAVLSLIASHPALATGREAMAEVLAAVREPERLEADLQHLCDEIGPRMAGTPGMRAALDWAHDSLVSAGLGNVRIEPVTMPLKWQEGMTRVEVTDPWLLPLRVAASALSPPVPDWLAGDLAAAGSGKPGGISGQAARFRGKILLVELDEATTFEDQGVEQRDAMTAMREAAKAGALAVLFVSTRPNRLLYRHINSFTGTLDPLPSGVVAREDGLRLVRLLKGGTPVRLRLHLPNRIGPSFETGNLVAEIPGHATPRQVVLLGAHLDSWDMGTGCQDNAANVALVMHVARALAASAVPLRRTLRIVLFGGEEFGLFGARAYVERYRGDLDRHVAVIVHDMGGGRFRGYSVGPGDELVPLVRALLAPLDPGRNYTHRTNLTLISDSFAFRLHGVPTLFGLQDTTAYAGTYHSEADTYDKIRIEHLVEAALAAAAVSMGFANRVTLPTARWPRRRVAKWLEFSRLDEYLDFLGVTDLWLPQAPVQVPGPAVPGTATGRAQR